MSAHEHSWCVCFGSCPCNLAECVMCGAERPLTDEELSAKHTQARTDMRGEA